MVVTSVDGRVLMCALVDYTLANPDTLTKYKTAATIAEKVLQEVTGASFYAHQTRASAAMVEKRDQLTGRRMVYRRC